MLEIFHVSGNMKASSKNYAISGRQTCLRCGNYAHACKCTCKICGAPMYVKKTDGGAKALWEWHGSAVCCKGEKIAT
jgi:hypothetical protein